MKRTFVGLLGCWLAGPAFAGPPAPPSIPVPASLLIPTPAASRAPTPNDDWTAGYFAAGEYIEPLRVYGRGLHRGADYQHRCAVLRCDGDVLGVAERRDAGRDAYQSRKRLYGQPDSHRVGRRLHDNAGLDGALSADWRSLARRLG